MIGTHGIVKMAVVCALCKPGNLPAIDYRRGCRKEVANGIVSPTETSC